MSIAPTKTIIPYKRGPPMMGGKGRAETFKIGGQILWSILTLRVFPFFFEFPQKFQ